MTGRVLASAAVLLAFCGSAHAACEDGRCREYLRDPAVTRAGRIKGKPIAYNTAIK